MSEFIIWTLILSVWNIILFYGSEYGISVLLFMLPLLSYIYYLMKKNNKIINPKGLLFMIPIVLLSITYLIFNSTLFYWLNFITIIILFLLMYIYTMNKTSKISQILYEGICLLFEPISYIERFFRVSTNKIREKLHLTNKSKNILKTVLIVLPILIVVILLLSSADMIFDNIFGNVLNKIWSFLKLNIFSNLIGRIVSFIILFFIIGCTSMYIVYEYPKKHEEKNSDKKVRDTLTIKTLVTSLNVVYIIFDFIQIKSLMLHSVSSSINYAQYARQGFFELLFVSIINVIVILISKKYENNNKKDNNYINYMSILMVFLTLVIIVSSFMRMNMYENAYGYTILRLLVYITLVTESILMIPTSMYIFNSKVDIIKSYIIIITISYVISNYINMDYLIARRNVNRYYINNKIDIDYLENYRTDNVKVLIELYNKTDSISLKNELGEYLMVIRDNNDNNKLFEFNISKYSSVKELKKLKLKHNNKYKKYRDYLRFE